ncbi:MAG TPA: DUF2085 domain-containing protein [Pyrinomonadaceae bacterium]|nr:DUF2085 domain-containing protein [Pyrinomonadaceae bacterium]
MPAPISEYVPQVMRGAGAPAPSRRAAVAWALGLGVAALLVGLILLAPAARARGWETLSLILYQGFAPVCHQLAERSFHLEGFPLAVCARCWGLYAGALAGLLFYPLARPLAQTDAPHRGWVIAAALPTSVDFALGFLGVWENTHWSRFLTAAVLGASAAFFVVPALVGLGLQLGRKGVSGAAVSGGP